MVMASTARVSSLLVSSVVLWVALSTDAQGMVVRAFISTPQMSVVRNSNHDQTRHVHHRARASSGRSRTTARKGLCSMSATAEEKQGAAYMRNKEALKQDLRHEYASFFEDFESERYLPNVEFVDPVTSFTGLKNYKKNLDMLGGRSALGRILFKDAGIVLHDIEEPGPYRLRTRWTLKVCFKALPWRPMARFTGISEYTVNEHARVVKQEDYWDSINLNRGRYESVNPLIGVKDFVGQILPTPEETPPGGRGEVGDLLRRAKDYEVRLFQAGGGEHGASSGLVSPEIIASREFDGDATQESISTNSQILMNELKADGLQTASASPRLLTPGVRKEHQVSVGLVEHDWPSLKC